MSSFSFDESKAAGLQCLKFDGPTVEWLRFVGRNRLQDWENATYDIISGPVANDNTMPVLNLYFKGAYSEEEAIRRLLPQRLRDQYAFKTERALACIDFKEAVAV